MPKRIKLRPRKICANYFLHGTISIMLFEYTALMLAKVYYKTDGNLFALAGMHFLFGMICWSFIQTVFTDPGEVPAFWGFRKGDPVSRRKRYWLICNVFKPERCHHWSSCNRWVLNMDHHCPWISNWIGFWNRKYFILLLFYVILGMYSYVIFMANDVFAVGKDIYLFLSNQKNSIILSKTLIITVAFLLSLCICFIMTTFFKFHLMLIMENKTTIEWIAKEHKPFNSVYDISLKHNIQQVFGK